jgi:hypothetical protein
VSVRLIDVSPTANPAYPQAECALRSFAAQFDADVDEVRLDFKNGNTARYFSMADETRTVVIDLALRRQCRRWKWQNNEEKA